MDSEGIFCHCGSGYISLDGQNCVTDCDGVGEISDGDPLAPRCVCDKEDGFTYIGGYCLCNVANGFRDDGAGDCECDTGRGFTPNGAYCVCDGIGFINDGGHCVCDAEGNFVPDDNDGCECDYIRGFGPNGV